jgi:GNAT superfamily N-acetyltransferase
VVGRDWLSNEHRKENTAFFGLFESIDDQAVADGLFAIAREWAAAHGASALRGPWDLSASQSGGFLIEGGDSPPAVLTGHSPRYYPRLVERAGFERWGADHLAYQLDLAPFAGDLARLPTQFRRVAARAARHSNVRVRSARLADWSAELERARDIYNESLTGLADFRPVTADEFAQLGESMRQILDPELVLFLEVDGRAVGLLVALPDINQALRFGSGLRNPWNYLRVWWKRRSIDRVSLKILAVVPAFHHSGLSALLYQEFATRVFHAGYRWLDLSLTGEDNRQTNRLAAMVGAKVYKRYRTYEVRLERLE